MPLYDLFLLLDPNAPDERRSSILGDVKKAIESGGELVGAHEWGTRRMTFEIDHRPDAEYHILQFKAEPGAGGLLERLEHNLKIVDGVLRFRVIKLKDGSPPPPEPRPDRPPRDERDGGYRGEREAVPAGVGAGTGDAVQEVAAAQAAPAPTDAVPPEVAPQEAAPMDAPPADIAPPAEAAPAPAEAAPAEAPPAPAEAPAAEAPPADAVPAEAPPAPDQPDQDAPA